MDCKVTALIVLLSFKACAQPAGLQLTDMSWPTNSGSTAVSIQSPTTQSLYWFLPEGFPYNGNVSAQDPQNISLFYGVSQTWQDASLAIGPGTGIGLPGFNYFPNNGFVGTDSNVWYVSNGKFNSTNYIFGTYYTSPSINTSICGVPFTGSNCFFFAPFNFITGTNYFLTVYSQSPALQFSNLYYFDGAISNWGKVNIPSQLPDSFVSGEFINPEIFFPGTITNVTVCISLFGSNSPCTMTPPNDLYLTVITNSQDTFTLPGFSPTYIISAQPTNGYLTNLNSSTGQVTYVETNNSALVDYFIYCTSNSTVCDLCAPVNVNIITSNEVTCGQCFKTPIVNGGAVTGTIYFNTGIPNENVCISYTNISCVNTTNCTTTDSYGNASFFVLMCSGSSNYCIVKLQLCNSTCLFNDLIVTGVQTNAGQENFNGLFQLDNNQSSPPGFIVLTNTVPGGGPGGTLQTTLTYYPFGVDNLGLGFPQYGILWDTGYSDAVMYTTNPADCTDKIMTNWTLTTIGSNYYSLPTSSIISNTIPYLQCTNICP